MMMQEVSVNVMPSKYSGGSREGYLGSCEAPLTFSLVDTIVSLSIHYINAVIGQAK